MPKPTVRFAITGLNHGHIYGQTHSLNISILHGLTIRMWEHFEVEVVMAAIDTTLNSTDRVLEFLQQLEHASLPSATARADKRLPGKFGLQSAHLLKRPPEIPCITVI